MRVSVDKDDPGYRADAPRYRAFRNGVEEKYCVTADEEQGYVIVLVIDENGQPTMTEDGQSIQHMTLHGNVRVERIKP
jgi:hypothetical protein